jgi:putative addiction module component (TIGR02574 family)
MNQILKIDELLVLPVDDRLAIIDALWQSLSADPSSIPVPDWHAEIVANRLAEDETSSMPGETWEALRKRIEGRP